MSDFGAPVVNWRPLPRAARQTSACASRFSPEKFGFSLFEWPNFVSPGDL